jgi:hypothetical protein
MKTQTQALKRTRILVNAGIVTTTIAQLPARWIKPVVKSVYSLWQCHQAHYQVEGDKL